MKTFELRPILTACTAAILVITCTLLGARAGAAEKPPSGVRADSAPSESLKAAAGSNGATSPGGTTGFSAPADRADLVFPPDLVEQIRAKVNHTGRPLGYTSDQMKTYGRDTYRLRTMENLFRDATALPRESGRITDDLLRAVGALPPDPAQPPQGAAAPGLPELTRLLYTLTDVSSGRGYVPPVAMDSIPADTIPGWTIAASERRAWTSLPLPVRRFVAGVLLGGETAAPWMRASWQPCTALLLEATGASSPGEVRLPELYRAVSAPWWEEQNDQTATLSRIAFDLLARVDREYLAYGSIIYLTHVQKALDAFRAELSAHPDLLAQPVSGASRVSLPEPFPERISFVTALGRVVILGPGAESVGNEDAALILDLGGNTSYAGRVAGPISLERPFSLLVDLSGDDVYDAGAQPLSLGAGFLGLGGIIDLEGSDVYRNADSGIACAWFGTGLIFDAAGNDLYETQKNWSQGHALAGVAMLVDAAGDDRYSCGSESQAHGSTLGAALLLDLAGNDHCIARDDGNVSALYLNQSVAMSQGCGQGRRADLGDGHSFAGGFGILVDAAGDDEYHAQVWAQGCAYWWSVGILEDRGGNDTYRNGKYSLGAAAHFAIGVQVDAKGDDRYNVGNDTAVNQYHGHARDGSIGVAVDGDGNDEYLFRNHCGGSGDLGSIGIFWDRRGDDVYRVRWNDLGPPNGWTETPPMGSATSYPLFRSYRDELMTVGVFVDTGGHDRYEWDGPADRWLGGDSKEWTRDRGPISWSYGADLDR